MNELSRQLAQSQPKKNVPAQTPAITPRPAPKDLSPQDKQLWDLRESLRISKSQTLVRVSNSSPKAREAAMQAWQAQNKKSLAKLSRANAASIEATDARKNLETNPNEVEVPPMPSHLDASRQNDWDQIWILRHQKSALLKQLQDAESGERRDAMARWQETSGAQLEKLQQELLPQSQKARSKP